jgi:hypothetical protein
LAPDDLAEDGEPPANSFVSRGITPRSGRNRTPRPTKGPARNPVVEEPLRSGDLGPSRFVSRPEPGALLDRGHPSGSEVTFECIARPGGQRLQGEPTMNGVGGVDRPPFVEWIALAMDGDLTLVRP